MGMRSPKGVYHWSGQEAPFLCDVSPKEERARFPHYLPHFASRRLEHSHIASLFGDELGSNHPPSLGCQRQRGEGVLDGRRGLRSLELGSPLRLVQLCSARRLASNLENKSRILGVFEVQKAEIVIYHNLSPHSRPRQPLSLAPRC